MPTSKSAKPDLPSAAYFRPLTQGTKLTGVRHKLFVDRYAMRDTSGKPVEKFPEQMWSRVAWALSRVEKTPQSRKYWQRKFYQAMKDFKFLPAGRFLSSAGTGTQTTMINCFVIPSPHDSRKGIIKTLEHVTEISARGGGVGFNLSTLRPRGSYIKKSNGHSSGAVSWANLYSVAAHDIIQQGGTRRGALMIMLWDWHPDIEEFITVKQDFSKILGANLSVCVSDKFMQAVKQDKDWQLIFPLTDHPAYDLEWDGDIEAWQAKGYPIKVYRTLPARQLWNLIAESAWKSAEPGVVFLDRTNKMNNTWYFEKNICTNPCGEQPLPAWGVCNLSSINLSALVDEQGQFDFNLLRQLVEVGIRFLDNAIDQEQYLYEEIRQQQLKERRTGLGTTGLADALIKLKIVYGSAESLELIEQIYRTIRDQAYRVSVQLARERGPFPAFESDKYLQGEFIRQLPADIRAEIKRYGIRNALLLTQAPTGKISLLAGVSSGIEPVFSYSYKQTDRLGTRVVYHPLYKQWIDQHGEDNLPNYFVVADDLTPEEHIKVQALIQKYTDSSISKTVNAPNSHTVADVKRLYQLAYETGCKGVSYMREGSRQGTLERQKPESRSSKSQSGDQLSESNSSPQPVFVRPMKVSGATYKIKTPVGTAFITVNRDQAGNPIEVFINIGRAGSDIQAMAEALGRLISKSLKMDGGMSAEEKAMVIIDQFRGIGGRQAVGFGKQRVHSLPDAIAKALMMDLGLLEWSSEARLSVAAEAGAVAVNGNGHASSALFHLQPSDSTRQAQLSLSIAPEPSRAGDLCPECGNASMIFEEGCAKCHLCGFSRC